MKIMRTNNMFFQRTEHQSVSTPLPSNVTSTVNENFTPLNKQQQNECLDNCLEISKDHSPPSPSHFTIPHLLAHPSSTDLPTLYVNSESMNEYSPSYYPPNTSDSTSFSPLIQFSPDNLHTPTNKNIKTPSKLLSQNSRHQQILAILYGSVVLGEYPAYCHEKWINKNKNQGLEIFLSSNQDSYSHDNSSHYSNAIQPLTKNSIISSKHLSFMNTSDLTQDAKFPHNPNTTPSLSSNLASFPSVPLSSSHLSFTANLTRDEKTITEGIEVDVLDPNTTPPKPLNSNCEFSFAQNLNKFQKRVFSDYKTQFLNNHKRNMEINSHCSMDDTESLFFSESPSSLSLNISSNNTTPYNNNLMHLEMRRPKGRGKNGETLPTGVFFWKESYVANWFDSKKRKQFKITFKINEYGDKVALRLACLARERRSLSVENLIRLYNQLTHSQITPRQVNNSKFSPSLLITKSSLSKYCTLNSPLQKNLSNIKDSLEPNHPETSPSISSLFSKSFGHSTDSIKSPGHHKGKDEIASTFIEEDSDHNSSYTFFNSSNKKSAPLNTDILSLQSINPTLFTKPKHSAPNQDPNCDYFSSIKLIPFSHLNTEKVEEENSIENLITSTSKHSRSTNFNPHNPQSTPSSTSSVNFHQKKTERRSTQYPLHHRDYNKLFMPIYGTQPHYSTNFSSSRKKKKSQRY